MIFIIRHYRCKSDNETKRRDQRERYLQPIEPYENMSCLNIEGKSCKLAESKYAINHSLVEFYGIENKRVTFAIG